MGRLRSKKSMRGRFELRDDDVIRFSIVEMELGPCGSFQPHATRPVQCTAGPTPADLGIVLTHLPKKTKGLGDALQRIGSGKHIIISLKARQSIPLGL